jgi:cation diffusion facilitator CzcD-associated flavoprotein CzcO
MTSPRYCIIGAGAAGVSALQQLRQAGYHAECFEKTGRVGGHWHTDYEALHLITSRGMTCFEDFPMPAGYPHFPRRDQVRAYIESYAACHGLYDVINFSTEIVSITPQAGGHGPVGSNGWRVVSSRGDEGVFDGVLVANGHLWDPYVPPVTGEFTGRQLHSGEYGDVTDLEGDRILVVGAGNSGCDLAVDVAQHRLEADIVVRTGIYFQPKTYFGRPRQEVRFLQEFSPAEQDLINRLLARVSIGQNTDYPGLPAPAASSLAAGPVTVNDLLLYWIHHGRVRVVPGISRFAGQTVHFCDGTARDYDSIVWATGFNVRLPFLDDQLIAWNDKVPLRYAGGILPAGAEKLYFVGLIAPRGPQIPIYGAQAKVIARMIALHEAAGVGGLALSAYVAERQEPETRIDVVRHVWLDQLADTERMLSALEMAARHQRRPAPEPLKSAASA